MQALNTQIGYLKKKLTYLYRIQAKDIENQSTHVSEKCLALRSRLDEIKTSYLAVERDYQSRVENGVMCCEEVRTLRKQCEQAETRILKSVPEKTACQERYCRFASLPDNYSPKIIRWLYGYVAYLNGMALAVGKMEWFTPMLSLLRHDLESLDFKQIEYLGMQSLWKEVFEIRDSMRKWELEYTILKEEHTKPDETLAEVSIQETVDKEGSVYN